MEIHDEYVRAYSPVTNGHLCYFVNGMLSVPGGIKGLLNIFDVDSELLRYDETSMDADLEKYGLFTYEEFNELVPVRKEIFDIFNGQYLKISLGKGLTSIEELKYLVMRYSKFFN